jgi:hypothetical protein
LKLLVAFDADQLICLLTVLTLKLKARYRVEHDGGTTVMNIWGVGPQNLTEKDVGTYWKYVSRCKQFEPFPSKHFTQTTDIVPLKWAIEPRNC